LLALKDVYSETGEDKIAGSSSTPSARLWYGGPPPPAMMRWLWTRKAQSFWFRRVPQTFWRASLSLRWKQPKSNLARIAQPQNR
jgi:hypothetical protein